MAKIKIADNGFDVSHIIPALKNVAHLYPDFNVWLNNKFLHDYYKGKRDILFAHNGNDICGISLLKRTPEENKICTFYVLPEYQGNKIGSQLLDESLNYFDGEEATISVSTERLEELYPVLSSKGFILDNCVEHLYRHENIEHFFKTK